MTAPHPPPEFAAAAGAAYVVGREIFAFGYTHGGADKRLYGAVVLDIALVAMMGACFLGGLRHANIAPAFMGK